MKKKKLLVLFIPAIIVLILDQITKQMVLRSPSLQRMEIIEGWLAFNFTKNPGMALGMDWLSTPVISVIAITATIGIVVYILFTLNKANYAYLACMGLIVGGALGNISDRIFMAIKGGYGGVLEGHVVDFIHFTLTIGDWAVFPYIFNVADVAISTSIIILLIFHKRIMPVDEPAPENDESENPGEDYDMVSESTDPEKRDYL
ncbi:MAG: signal peptidase II [Balneolaceae bacterium]|nr:MAG: signal peptidase II [Balneolaceae bacterium]